MAPLSNKMGVVVPYDKATELGYRQLHCTGAALRKLLAQIEGSSGEERVAKQARLTRTLALALTLTLSLALTLAPTLSLTLALALALAPTPTLTLTLALTLTLQGVRVDAAKTRAAGRRLAGAGLLLADVRGGRRRESQALPLPRHHQAALHDDRGRGRGDRWLPVPAKEGKLGWG